MTRHRILTSSQDIITDDEMISDSYDLKEIDGVVYEADCRKINIGGESFGTYWQRGCVAQLTDML